MKIKMLCSRRTPDAHLPLGHVVDVPDDVGRELIKHGAAIAVAGGKKLPPIGEPIDEADDADGDDTEPEVVSLPEAPPAKKPAKKR